MDTEDRVTILWTAVTVRLLSVSTQSCSARSRPKKHSNASMAGFGYVRNVLTLSLKVCVLLTVVFCFSLFGSQTLRLATTAGRLFTKDCRHNNWLTGSCLKLTS